MLALVPSGASLHVISPQQLQATPHGSGGAYKITCQLFRLIFSKFLLSVSFWSQYLGAGLTSVTPSGSVPIAHLVRPIPHPLFLPNRLFSGFLISVTSFVSLPSILLASHSFSMLGPGRPDPTARGRPDPSASPAVSRLHGFPCLPCRPRAGLPPFAVLVLTCSSAPVPWGEGTGFRADGHQEDTDHWILPCQVPRPRATRDAKALSRCCFPDGQENSAQRAQCRAQLAFNCRCHFLFGSNFPIGCMVFCLPVGLPQT